MKPAITIANGFLHPDIIVRGKPGDRLVQGHVLPTYEQETRIGAGAYTALVVAAQGIGCSLLDRVGTDIYGEMTMSALKERDLDLSGIERYAGAHMFCLSIVDEAGEGGTMVINYPEPWRRNIQSFRSELTDASSPVIYLYSWYWSFAHPELAKSKTSDLVRIAASDGKTVLLDVNYKPADPPPVNDMEQLRLAVRHVDVLMPNARDAALMVGDLDRVKTIAALQELGAKRIVLKCGAEGVYVSEASGAVAHIRAPTVPVLDTTGAGDCFGGGFASAWTRGAPLLRAAAEGAAAAALAISSPADRKYRPLSEVSAMADTLEIRSIA